MWTGGLFALCHANTYSQTILEQLATIRERVHELGNRTRTRGFTWHHSKSHLALMSGADARGTNSIIELTTKHSGVYNNCEIMMVVECTGVLKVGRNGQLTVDKSLKKKSVYRIV